MFPSSRPRLFIKAKASGDPIPLRRTGPTALLWASKVQGWTTATLCKGVGPEGDTESFLPLIALPEAIFSSRSSSPHMAANSEYQSQFRSEGLKHMSKQREKPSDSLSSRKECEFVFFLQAGLLSQWTSLLHFWVHLLPGQMAPASLFSHRLQINCNTLWDVSEFHPLTRAPSLPRCSWSLGIWHLHNLTFTTWKRRPGVGGLTSDEPFNKSWVGSHHVPSIMLGLWIHMNEAAMAATFMELAAQGPARGGSFIVIERGALSVSVQE